jgi:DNA-binding LytR/AlgR family response regulator
MDSAEGVRIPVSRSKVKMLKEILGLV